MAPIVVVKLDSHFLATFQSRRLPGRQYGRVLDTRLVAGAVFFYFLTNWRFVVKWNSETRSSHKCQVANNIRLFGISTFSFRYLSTTEKQQNRTAHKYICTQYGKTNQLRGNDSLFKMNTFFNLAIAKTRRFTNILSRMLVLVGLKPGHPWPS